MQVTKFYKGNYIDGYDTSKDFQIKGNGSHIKWTSSLYKEDWNQDNNHGINMYFLNASHQLFKGPCINGYDTSKELQIKRNGLQIEGTR